MALSGTLNSSAFESRYLQFTWSATQSVSGNYSTISWALKGAGGDSAYWYKAGNFTVKIDGSTVYSTGQNESERIYLYGGTTVASGTKTIYHNDNGSRTFSVSISGAIYNYAANVSGSTTFTLNTIDRYPNNITVSSPTTSTIDETTKALSVTWSKSNRGTYTVEVSKNGGSYSVAKSGIALTTTSYSYSFTPKQGDTYRFRVKAVYNSLSSSYSYSGTVTINNLTAPTIGTIPSVFNPYVSRDFTINLSGGSQKNGGAFMRRAYVEMKRADGNMHRWEVSKPANNNTSVTITILEDDIIAALGTKKYSSEMTVGAWTENANGSMSSIVTKKTTVNINSDGGAKPTLNTPTLSGGFTGYTSTCFIAGIHNLGVTANASTNRAPSGTTLSYSISCTGFSDVKSRVATFTKPTGGKKVIKVTVTDSRGLSTSKTVYCRFQKWSAPTIKITSATRNETIPSTIDVKYTVSYTPIYDTYENGDTAGTNINTISSQQYTTASSYSNCTSPLAITETNTDKGYTITIRVADKIKSTTYSTTSKYVGTIDKYISMRNNCIGLGCIPDAAHRLDIKGAARFYDDNGTVRIANGKISTSAGIHTAGDVAVEGKISTLGNIYIPNNKYIYWNRADGTTAQGVLILNSDNNFAINYGSYSAEVGSTNVYGNSVKLFSKNAITTNNSLEVNENGSCIGTARFNATWVGMYPSHSDATGKTNRKWWIGHNTTDNLYIANETGNKYVMFDSSFVLPKENNSTYLGGSSYRWNTVFSVNALNTSSDRNYKKNILELDDRYEDLFNKLKPVTFERTFINSDRTHIGFISQDIEESMNDVGLTAMDFAGFCKDIKTTTNNDGEEIKVLNEDGNYEYEYSLRYEEFIALNTHMIQKLQKEIEELKQMVKEGK